MDWLKEIVNRLLSVFPSVVILAPHEAGVRITLGKHIKSLGAGIYVFWPMIQRILWIEIKTQVNDLRVQSCWTSDGKNVAVGGAIMYYIKDARKALLEVQDFDKSLNAMATGIILEFVNKRTLDDCRDIEKLKAEILKGIKADAQGWGLQIQRVYINDIGSAINVRLLGNSLKDN